MDQDAPQQMDKSVQVVVLGAWVLSLYHLTNESDHSFLSWVACSQCF